MACLCGISTLCASCAARCLTAGVTTPCPAPADRVLGGTFTSLVRGLPFRGGPSPSRRRLGPARPRTRTCPFNFRSPLSPLRISSPLWFSSRPNPGSESRMRRFQDTADRVSALGASFRLPSRSGQWGGWEGGREGGRGRKTGPFCAERGAISEFRLKETALCAEELWSMRGSSKRWEVHR